MVRNKSERHVPVNVPHNGRDVKTSKDAFQQKRKIQKTVLPPVSHKTTNRSGITIVNGKASDGSQLPNSQKKVQTCHKKDCYSNPYEPKQMHVKQSAKKRTVKRTHAEWEKFEKIIEADINTLQQIDVADKDSVFRYGAKILDKIQEAPGGSTVQKLTWEGHVYYCFMKAYHASGDHNTTLKYISFILRLANCTGDKHLLNNCYNVAAKIYVKQKEYEKAANLWEKMYKHTENATDHAYILYEIGKCHCALSQWSLARAFGHLCLPAAAKSGDQTWCTKAYLLLGVANTRLKCPEEALQAFQEAERYAANREDVLKHIGGYKKHLKKTAGKAAKN